MGDPILEACATLIRILAAETVRLRLPGPVSCRRRLRKLFRLGWLCVKCGKSQTPNRRRCRKCGANPYGMVRIRNQNLNGRGPVRDVGHVRERIEFPSSERLVAALRREEDEILAQDGTD